MGAPRIETDVCLDVDSIDIGQYGEEIQTIEALPVTEKRALATYLAEQCFSCPFEFGDKEPTVGEVEVDESGLCSIAVQRAVLMAADTEGGWDVSPVTN